MKGIESNIKLIKQLAHQNKLSPEIIEFGYFITKKHRDLSSFGLLACIACVNAFTEGRTAVDERYIHSFIAALKLKNNLFDEVSEQLYEEAIIGRPGDLNFFIFEDGLLYMHSFFEFEQELVAWITNTAKQAYPISPAQQEIIEELYPVDSSVEDLQRYAVLLSLIKPLMFLTGGPGTGKTYTVQKIIEIHRALFGQDYQIGLAAPTGKAAQRINDSISGLEDESLQAQTIHRLLGAKKGFDDFKFNKKKPLAIDLLIIDEASMMDISLWIALINALPQQAKLIIVGDNNQLASVEAGAVLSDICSSADNRFSSDIAKMIGLQEQGSHVSDLNDSIIRLQKSKRFGAKTGIQALAEAIRQEDAEQVIELLENEGIEDVQLIENTAKNRNSVIKDFAVSPYFDVENLKALDENVILCALKNGEVGSRKLNLHIEELIKQRLQLSKSKEWYPNRKVLVTRNQPTINVRNGEVGYYSEENDSVQFIDNSILINRLQYFEPGYCLTIHKSQGSEYKNVALVLPNVKNRVLSKELLYTGVTRAGLSVLIVGSKQLIKDAILAPTIRNSGLKRKLWDLS